MHKSTNIRHIQYNKVIVDPSEKLIKSLLITPLKTHERGTTIRDISCNKTITNPSPTKWIEALPLLGTNNVIQSLQIPQRNNKVSTNPSPQIE